MSLRKYPIVAWSVYTLLMLALVAVPPRTQAQQGGTVQPPVGRPGFVFVFAAGGFEDNERVSYWVNGPDGDVLDDNADDAEYANGDGRVDWSWRSDDGLPDGVYSMVAQGNDSDHEVLIPFEIRADANVPGQAPPPGAGAAVDPQVAGPGTRFAFSASGFSAGERVGYWVNTPGGGIIEDGEDFATSANSAGEAWWEWSAPASAVRGVYIMSVRGEISQIEHTIMFEIR